MVNNTPVIGRTKTKILIADDSATDRLLLKAILVKQGHEVIDVVDGLDAVTVFQRDRPEIVLLDALMPNMDGFEAAEKIKDLAGEDFIPIIFLTSLQEADSLARCLDAGGDDFLTKPYNSVILQAKINAFIRMREMHSTVQKQRDEIAIHNSHLLHQQDVAKRIFDRIAHADCLEAPNIKYTLSPIAVFNGDVLLAGVNPAGKLTILLGDFTGHGLHAAIGAMPLAETFYTMLEKGFSLREIIREINLKLYEFLPVEVFCCALFAEIDFTNGTVKAWNSGLPDCIIYSPSNKKIVRLVSSHIPLGISSTANLDCTIMNYEVNPGDRLYAWSDGIHEARNSKDEMFGEQRLLSVFNNNIDEESLFCDVNDAVNEFVGEEEAGDDISIVEVTIVKPKDFEVLATEVHPEFEDGPNDWSFSYELRQDTLRDFDPLPLLLQILLQVPSLRRFGGQIFTILAELYANALDHGVLGLSSSIKISPGGFAEYYRQREYRLAALTEGAVLFDLSYKGDGNGGCLSIDVTDSGAGFNHSKMLNKEIVEKKVAGRGIFLVRSLCKSIEYSDTGNKVCAIFVWGSADI
ncbi:MAG: CheY-like chemotaxis protein [Gammaproteobacteria bacterium]|jgi:CheY-like chemotaxis protein